MSASAQGEIVVDSKIWISLRASSDGPSADVFDLYPYAVTSPVYATVDGKTQHSPRDADYFITWIDRLIDYAAKGEFNTQGEREIVLANFREARKVFEKRR